MDSIFHASAPLPDPALLALVAVLDLLFHVVLVTTFSIDCFLDNHRVQVLLSPLLPNVAPRALSTNLTTCSTSLLRFLQHIRDIVCLFRRSRKQLTSLTSAFCSRRTCRLLVVSHVFRLSRWPLRLLHLSRESSIARQYRPHVAGFRFKKSLSLRHNLLLSSSLSTPSFFPRHRLCLRPSASLFPDLSANCELVSTCVLLASTLPESHSLQLKLFSCA